MQDLGKYPRRRSEGSFSGDAAWVRTYWLKNSAGAYTSGPTTSTTANSDLWGTTREMSDWVTPNFAQAIAKGAIVNNPMFSKVERRYHQHCLPAVYEGRLNANSALTHTEFSGVYAPLTGHMLTSLDLLLEAVTAAWSKVNGPDWWAAVDSGEILETVRLLGSPLQAVRNILSDPCGSGVTAFMYQGKRLRKVRCPGIRLIPGLSTMYLGWHLGLAPLFASIEDAIALIDKEFKTRLTARSTKRASEVKTQAWQPPVTFVSGGQNVTWNWTLETTDEASARAGVLYSPDISIAQDTGFDAKHLPSTAWELIPYSFIVDRFLNIGDYLTGLIQFLTVEPLASWCTLRRTQQTTLAWGSCSATPYTGYTPTQTVHPSGLIGVVTTETTIRSTHLKPALVWKPSQVQLDTKLKHYLDYASLLALSIAGKGRRTTKV